MQQLIRATINTWNGLLAATRGEAAFRKELIVLALAVLPAFAIGRDGWTRLLLILVLLLVLVVELLNSAIERLADRVSSAPDPTIGRVKDMSSAAVGVMLGIAALTWLFALADRLTHG